MALLQESLQEKKFDTRLIDRHLTRGVVAEKDYQAAIQSLPDDSEAADYVSIEVLDDLADV